MEIDQITQNVLNQIDDAGFKQEGAYNLRYNGQALCHGDSEHIKIKKREDGNPGINVYISKDAQDETVHIPVVISKSGMNDEVYNDFYIEAGAKVNIIAGCGIHNSGCNDSRHDGIHSFHVGEGAQVTYAEKHYGEGEGTGGRFLNPQTRIYVGKDAQFNLDTAQIKGVDSTKRVTYVELEEGAKIYVTERLMTHDEQQAASDMDVVLNGKGSSAQIISRSVAKGRSVQVFHPKAIGNNDCHAHIQCDSIIMNEAKVSSIPEINANHVEAAIIHEAAIGRINNDQVTKLRTMGLSAQEAENVIIEAFLN